MNDIVKEKKKKFVIIILLIILIPLILCIAIGVIDYFRAVNGKKPIFIYHTVSTSNIDFEVGVPKSITLPSNEYVTSVGIGENIVTFNDIVLPNKEGAIYYGIGYSVSICDNETENYTFQLGGKKVEPCSSTLTCTKTIAENNKQSFEYFFFDGKVYRLHTTLTIPAEQIADEEAYKEELIEINDIKGCAVTFNKHNDIMYVTKMCNISNMSNSDVENVYSVSKKSMEQTREEIIDKYSNDKDMVCE